MSTKAWILLTLVIISAVLLAISIKLWRELAKQAELRRQQDKSRDDHLAMSLGLIAQTTLQDDLPMAEVAIRSKMLLDHLIPEERARSQYQAIYALHDATEHFARLEARDALTLKERREQDAQREKLEALHREGVLACMRSILHDGFK